MLVLQPSTSTPIVEETGGRVAVFVAVGASVKDVAVTEGVVVMGAVVKVTKVVAVGLDGSDTIVSVAVMNTGVGVWMDGVMVGGGAGKVGTW